MVGCLVVFSNVKTNDHTSLVQPLSWNRPWSFVVVVVVGCSPWSGGDGQTSRLSSVSVTNGSKLMPTSDRHPKKDCRH
jgi:hypothetical protein